MPISYALHRTKGKGQAPHPPGTGRGGGVFGVRRSDTAAAAPDSSADVRLAERITQVASSALSRGLTVVFLYIVLYIVIARQIARLANLRNLDTDALSAHRNGQTTKIQCKEADRSEAEQSPRTPPAGHGQQAQHRQQADGEKKHSGAKSDTAGEDTHSHAPLR